MAVSWRMWALRTELCSFSRAAWTPNCWASSPDPKIALYVLWTTSCDFVFVESERLTLPHSDLQGFYTQPANHTYTWHECIYTCTHRCIWTKWNSAPQHTGLSFIGHVSGTNRNLCMRDFSKTPSRILYEMRERGLRILKSRVWKQDPVEVQLA